jgi:hypothetical protein
MRGHGLKSACIIISVFILLSLLLFPGISHAVRYGHIKQVEEPVSPEIKCGEPGDEPFMNSRESFHFNHLDMPASNDSQFNKSVSGWLIFYRFFRFAIFRSCAL